MLVQSSLSLGTRVSIIFGDFFKFRLN